MGGTPRPAPPDPPPATPVATVGPLMGLSAWGTPGRVGQSAVAPGDNRAIVAHSGLFLLPCEAGGLGRGASAFGVTCGPRWGWR